MPSMPNPPPPWPRVFGGGAAAPVVGDLDRRVRESRQSTVTRQCPVPACRTTLVTASWMMRNADRSMSAGSGRRGPSQRSSTRTPGVRRGGGEPAEVGQAWCWLQRPDQDRACRGAALRFGPTQDAEHAAAARPGFRGWWPRCAVRALRASAGWVSMTRRPTPAWIAMMPMLCTTHIVQFAGDPQPLGHRRLRLGLRAPHLGLERGLPDRVAGQPGDDRGQQDNHVELDRHLQALGHEHGRARRRPSGSRPARSGATWWPR